MRLKNPNYISPAAAIVANRKAAVQAYLTANAALPEISFDKIRADFPALAAELTDGNIAEICRELGLTVITE